MVKRFSFMSAEQIRTLEVPDGNYVRFEDYDRLQRTGD